MRVRFLACVIAGLLVSVACSDSSAPADPAPAPRKTKPTVKKSGGAAATPKTAASTAPAIPENYSYQSAGRRDPFTSMIGAGNSNEPHAVPQRGEGLAGMLVNELSVRGVMQSRGTFLAMVQGPDKKTYIVHPGDKFMDGTVKAINPQGLVIVQNVNDPLSIEKQREVRKLLRSLEDAKP